MAMMRRGPLAQYPAEWVLQQACTSEATGSVEFHSPHPLTLYLRNGRLCHGIEGVPASARVASDAPEPTDEAAERARIVTLVGRAMRASEGWYSFDPLGRHDGAGPWQWESAAVIRDARSQVHAAARPATAPVQPPVSAPAASSAAAGPSADRVVHLVVPADGRPVTLTAESWRLVCALAPECPEAELRSTLGWPADRMGAALAELAAAGVLGLPSAAPEARPVSATATPVPASGTEVEPSDRRRALRRLISNAKPT